MIVAILLLRIIHVLSAMFWVGATIFLVLFLAPAVAASGPSAGPVFGALQRRGMTTALPIVAVLTLLSGFTLFWIAGGGSLAAYVTTRVGATFGIAGTIALVAFAFGMTVARPSGIAAGRLAREMVTAAEADRPALQQRLAALQRRSGWSTMLVMILLITAATGMAVARYM